MAYINTNVVLYVVIKSRFSHSDLSKFILVKAFCQLHLVILIVFLSKVTRDNERDVKG
jgi:hypothetical protein